MKKKGAKTEEAKKLPIVKKELTKTLKCALTSEEVLAYADQLTEAIDEHARVDSELASVKKTFGSKIGELECRITRMTGLVRDKVEYRDVKVERVLDYKKGTVTETRQDTKEIIDVREMTDQERQRELPLDEPKSEE